MTTNEDCKLPLSTPDPTRDVVEQLRETAPQLFSEDKIDFDKLKELLGGQVEQGTERYGLSWAGKSEAFRNVQSLSIGTLLPMPDDSVNWDSTENLIIEGDNLEVLKLLQKPYHGKVKMIYIDPPYNTGNEFIYPDNFREGLKDYLRYSGQVSEEGVKQSTNTETSGRFHSTWLSMMYPRLFLARNLLKDDGVIFVSINDAEMHNLRLLMDLIFGEEKFIGVLIWKSRHNVDSRNQTGLSSDHEYVLCYGKKISGQQIDENKYSNPDNDIRGLWMSDNMVGLASKEQRPNLHYDLINPETNIVYACPEKGWRYDRNTMAKKISEKRVLWPSAPEGRPRHKRFLLEVKSQFTGFSSLLKVPNTAAGTQEVRDLFGAAIFDFPKPAGLLNVLVEQGTECNSNDIVLDFFAGSGTTAQAVMELNREDNGNRTFILVQLPEKTENPQFPTIAHITRERVQRVIQKLARGDAENAEKTAKEPGLPFPANSAPPCETDFGFRAFKLSSSNFKIWDADHAPATADALAEQLKLYADNVERLRDQQDILYELILKTGKPLSSRIDCLEIEGSPVYSVSEGQLLICLENPIKHEVLRGMMACKPSQILCLDTAFGGDDALKTNTVLEAKSHGVVFRTV